MVDKFPVVGPFYDAVGIAAGGNMSHVKETDALRLRHQRIENERHHMRQKLSHVEHTLRTHNLTHEQHILQKQHERLLNEKQYNKNHSYLTKDRQLSNAEQSVPSNKSSHATPNTTNVKSKLFDFKKSAPRSRRQLMENTDKTHEESPSITPLIPNATRAMETHAMDWRSDIVHQLTVTNGTADKPRKKSPNRDKADHLPTIDATALERKASRRSATKGDQRVSFETPDPTVCMTTGNDHTKKEGGPRRGSNYSDAPRPSIQIDIAGDDDDSEKLQVLFNKAIETVQQADASATMDKRQSRGKDRRSSDTTGRSGLNMDALHELEMILNDARLYSSRKSSKEEHTRLDLGTNRAQKKRIEHLEQVLRQLNPSYYSGPELDPVKVLQCAYLRLSKSNVESLESMIRSKGSDPGIHIHSDVTDYDIFKGMKEERTDLQTQQKEKKAKRSKRPIKS